MKKTAILVAVALMAATSFAYVNVTWEACGFLNKDGSASAATDAKELLWCLVYTTGSSVAAPKLDEKADDPAKTPKTLEERLTFADQVLSTRTWTKDGDTWSVENKNPPSGATSSTADLAFVSDEYGAYTPVSPNYKNPSFDMAGGGLYAAIFQYCSDGNVYWADSGIVTKFIATSDTTPPDNVSFDMDTSTNVANHLGQVKTIPEPATMSLLGLGALAMVIRRKLRK